MDLKDESNDLEPDLDADDNSWLEDDNTEDYDEDKRSRSGSTQFVHFFWIYWSILGPFLVCSNFTIKPIFFRLSSIRL